MAIELREVLDAIGGNGQQPIPVEVGKAYLFRTIGYHWLGRVVSVCGRWITLDDASWVADTGRYSESLAGDIGSLQSSEIEPSPRPVLVNSDHVTDAVSYPFEIPRSAK